MITAMNCIFLYCFVCQYQSSDWLWRPPPKWPILCRVGRRTLLQPTKAMYSYYNGSRLDLPYVKSRSINAVFYCRDYIIYLYMHCNFICGLSDVVIRTFSQSVSQKLRWRVTVRNAPLDALHRLSGTHCRKLFSIVTLLQFLGLG